MCAVCSGSCCLSALTLSWRRPLSYRNQSIDLLWKSVDWFLYDNGLRHERVKFLYMITASAMKELMFTYCCTDLKIRVNSTIVAAPWIIFVPYIQTCNQDLLPTSTDAVVRSCSVEKVFLEVLKNSQENTCVRISFFNKVADLSPATLLKKRLWHMCFPVNFAKFVRTLFFTEHLRSLLLHLRIRWRSLKQ